MREYAIIEEKGIDIYSTTFESKEEAILEAYLLWAKFITKANKKGRKTAVGRLAHPEIEDDTELDEVFARYENGVAYVQDASGNWLDFEACVSLMDDDIREDLHSKLAPCPEQEFYEAYVQEHLTKYGTDFTI